MKVSHLLKELGGDQAIEALNEFNTYVEENSDSQGVIHGFLLASNKCNEILDILSAEKRTSSEVAEIFTALSHILLNIAGDLKEFKSVGLHITHEIMHNHYMHVYKFLLPSNTNKTIKSLLRCLTGMVMIEEAANTVLMTLDWQRINIPLLVNRKSFRDVRDVRAWCTYLLLAFLNASEDPHIIKQFLQKKDILPAIFPGLMWDPCERVINVLKVMHESVLLNPNVSKTMKVDIFTPSTTKPLIELYSWMGPMGRLAKEKNIQEMGNEIQEDIQKERIQIREVLHKFMLTLCSSVKYGIIFKEKIQEGQIKSNNWYIYKIVSNMKTPWESFEGRQLMSHTLGACPDLLKTYFSSLKDFLSPRPTEAFTSFVELLIEIIVHQEPWKRLDTKGFGGVLACLLPLPLNQQFFLSLVQSCYITVRYSGLRLIHAILSKTKETKDNIIENDALSLEIKQLTCKKLVNSVFKVFKIGDTILYCWNVASGLETPDDKSDGDSISITETAPPVPKVNELLIIAKILSLYTELVPNKTILEDLNPVKMLQIVKALPAEDNNSKAKLELQVLCLEFLSDSKHSQEIAMYSSMVVSDQNQQREKNILYQLISTFAQTKKEFMVDDDPLMLSVTDKCLNILSNSLSKLGLSSHYGGDIRFWLKHISSDSGVKLSVFLTQVIQKTVSSLSQYTDFLVEMGAKHNLHTSVHGQIYSFITELETMEVVDNDDVSAISFSMPFSHLVLGAIDLLVAEPDTEYIQYFSNVIKDYIHSLNDTGFIAEILLQNENILTSDVKEYLKCLCRESYPKVKKAPLLTENAHLSEILKYLFMTHDWVSVEKLLEKSRLKEEIKDLELVVLQLLLYIHLESDSKKKGTKFVKRYTHILKDIHTVFEEDCDNKSAEQVTQIVLEHPRILASYQPFSVKKSSITELAQEFIQLALDKYPTIAPKTHSYFDKLVKEILTQVTEKDISVDFWNPVAPFILSTNTLVSYEEVEQLFIICLKAPCFSSDSQITLMLELSKLLLKTTSAKRKSTTEFAQLMLTKFIEWGTSGGGSERMETIMKTLEKLLIYVIDTEVAEQLTKDDMKCLLQSHPPCADLCCHLVKQHPPHGLLLAKHLKKHGAVLPAQASLLAMLMEQEKTVSIAEAALVKLSDNIKMWALAMDDNDDATNVLFAFALKKDLLDKSALSEICSQLYENIVRLKQPPPKKFLSLIPVFDKLYDVEPVPLNFDLSGEHLPLLHICLGCIRNTYHKEQHNATLLMSVCKTIMEILPRVNESSFQRSLATNKLWSSFVKQVLRAGLSDECLGPELVHTLGLLCEVMYKNSSQRGGDKKDSVLPINTLYQMILTHSQYLTLMINRTEKGERLKEEVVALQQILVDCDQNVCQESHVPVLLGAYGASMSAVDQRILKLLYTYEKKGYMSNYQPVLWSDAAVAHFGVESTGFNLFIKPKPEQILGLLDMDKIIQTCHNFDTRLPLEPKDIQNENKSIYDIRFLIPLMLYLAGEERMSELEYAECGAVAIGFITMTSHQREVWGTGAAILRCMVEKMEKSRHQRLKLPWLWLVGVVSCAFEGKQRRLPAITTHFLIHASQLLSQPGHPMYQPVLNYLFIRPTFKVYNVPELYRLYSSVDVADHRKHRSFLLTTLATGIRQILDYRICQRSFTSTLMIAMLQAPTTDIELRVQVLEVIEAMVRINHGAVDLVRNQNLLTVLPLVVLSVNTVPASTTKTGNPIIIAAVVKVLCALWNTLINSITREHDIIAYSSEEEENVTMKLQELKENKRKSADNDLESRKKVKKEFSDNDYDNPDSDVYESDSEIIEAELNNKSKPETDAHKTKILPPIFVHEFLNCLTLLIPTVITCAPPAITAQHLVLVMETVKYIETVAELLGKKSKLSTTALSPEVIKQQVYNHVSWDHLYERLQDHLSDDDEVKLLGSKAKDRWHEWRSEPLCKRLKKQAKNESDDAGKKQEHQNLGDAVIKLLNILGM